MKVLKLQEPVKVGSETISELEIQKVKAKHLRKLPSNPNMGDLLNLAGEICGQPPSVIDELGSADAMELLEIVGNFILPGQQTGAKA